MIVVPVAGIAVFGVLAAAGLGAGSTNRIETSEVISFADQSVTLPGQPGLNSEGAATTQSTEGDVLVVQDSDSLVAPKGPATTATETSEPAANTGSLTSTVAETTSTETTAAETTAAPTTAAETTSTETTAAPTTAAETTSTETTAAPTTAAETTSTETTAAPTTAAETTSTETTAAPTTKAPPAAPAAAGPPAGMPNGAARVTGSAPGTDRRIIYVDKNGGNYNNPGTIDRPMGRPIDALSRAKPGDTIYIRGGVYDTNTDGAFNIRNSGTPQNWIRVAPYPGEKVELRAGGQYGSGFEVLGASYIEVSGFTITGRNDSVHGAGVFIKDRAHNVRVVGNTIRNFGGGGVSVVESSMITIEGNDVRDNAHRSSYQGSGISVFEAAGPTIDGYSFVIRGNYVARNYNTVPSHKDGRITDGNCIILDRNNEVGYQGHTLIENNVCVENGGRGIHFYRSSNIMARNNTMYHNMWSLDVYAGRGEMTVGYGRNVQFVNNLVINRPDVNSYVSNSNENTHFRNNVVASGPPPGDGNRELGTTNVFSSTDWNGSINQFRPLSGAGLAGSADGGRQPAFDYTGRNRPSPGSVGALEP